MRSVLRIIKKALLLSATFAVVVAALIGAINAFFPFFEKLSIISAAAAMPGGISKVFSASQTSSDTAVEKTEGTSSKNETVLVSSQTQTTSTTTQSKPKDAGKISEYAIAPSKTSSKIIWYSNAAFSNTSATSNSEILKLLKQSPEIKLAEGKPQVLIYHTHATESYEMHDLGYYEKGSSARTTDKKYNMVRVGEEIVTQLKEANIGVIHDTGLYDHPSYNGAYQRSAQKVQEYLKKYPSISVVLDIHRDAIEQDSGVRVKPTAEINGKKAAQVMIIAGVDDGTMDYKNWKENMKFASALQTSMEKSYPGLTRAAMVCHRRYNMHLSNNSLLIEVGGHANTLDEALYSGSLIGKSLVNVLKEYGQ